jgi:GNAT superfamily N-acetyltransferase
MVQRYASAWGYQVSRKDDNEVVTYELLRKDTVNEISRDRLERYLDRAGRQVDSRQEHMARVRDRLNKGYEIYRAEEPTKIVHSFEADTPAEAKRYYNNYIIDYESDVDYDLRLRRATGIMEDSENYGGIQLSLEIQKDDAYVDDDDTDNQVVFVKATANGRELGYVLFTIDYDSQGMILNPQDLEVDERFRRQGIAQTMYDFVKSKGYRIRRSGQQTDAGAGFWDRHRPEQNVWENFADGKKPGRKGLSKRVGIPKKATLGQLEKIARSSTGEKRRMAQWQLNMRRGRKK